MRRGGRSSLLPCPTLLLLILLATATGWAQPEERLPEGTAPTDDAEEPAAEERGIAAALQPRDSSERAAIEEDLDVITVGFEIIPSSGSGSYFTGYRRLFGTTTLLDVAFMPTVVGRLRLTDALRIVVGSSYLHTGFAEIYDAYGFPPTVVDPDPDSVVAVAQIYETMSATAFPLLAGLQWSPIRAQFTSYVGVQAGGAFATASWETITRPIGGSVYFRPETNVDEAVLIPALRLYTGLDLRFDRFFANGKTFRGVYLEAAYLYMPLSLEYFREIRTIGRGLAVLPPEDDASLNLGGFTVAFGVSIQLKRR